jgi:hypothetical protein
VLSPLSFILTIAGIVDTSHEFDENRGQGVIPGVNYRTTAIMYRR